MSKPDFGFQSPSPDSPGAAGSGAPRCRLTFPRLGTISSVSQQDSGMPYSRIEPLPVAPAPGIGKAAERDSQPVFPGGHSPTEPAQAAAGAVSGEPPDSNNNPSEYADSERRRDPLTQEAPPPAVDAGGAGSRGPRPPLPPGGSHMSPCPDPDPEDREPNEVEVPQLSANAQLRTRGVEASATQVVMTPDADQGLLKVRSGDIVTTALPRITMETSLEDVLSKRSLFNPYPEQATEGMLVEFGHRNVSPTDSYFIKYVATGAEYYSLLPILYSYNSVSLPEQVYSDPRGKPPGDLTEIWPTICEKIIDHDIRSKVNLGSQPAFIDNAIFEESRREAATRTYPGRDFYEEQYGPPSYEFLEKVYGNVMRASVDFIDQGKWREAVVVARLESPDSGRVFWDPQYGSGRSVHSYIAERSLYHNQFTDLITMAALAQALDTDDSLSEEARKKVLIALGKKRDRWKGTIDKKSEQNALWHDSFTIFFEGLGIHILDLEESFDYHHPPEMVGEDGVLVSLANNSHEYRLSEGELVTAEKKAHAVANLRQVAEREDDDISKITTLDDLNKFLGDMGEHIHTLLQSNAHTRISKYSESVLAGEDFDPNNVRYNLIKYPNRGANQIVLSSNCELIYIIIRDLVHEGPAGWGRYKDSLEVQYLSVNHQIDPSPNIPGPYIEDVRSGKHYVPKRNPNKEIDGEYRPLSVDYQGYARIMRDFLSEYLDYLE